MTLQTRIANAITALFRPQKASEQKSSSWERLFLRGLEHTISDTKVNQPYAEYGWVYIAIREIAVSIAQVPLRVYRGEKEIDNHEVQKLIDRPNPSMAAHQFKEAIASLLALEGNAFILPWWGEVRRKVPTQLYVYGRDYLKPKFSSDTGRVEFWEFQGKEKVNFPVEEVVHLKLYNPYDQLWGLSPVSVARLAIESDYGAQKYNKAVIDNNAQPSGILTVDSIITPETIKVLREQWEARHRGSGNANKLAVLQKGMDYKQTSLSQKDMEFLEARRYNREEVLAIWQIPKGVVGITDDLNYATLFGQKKIFWEDTITPYLRMIESGLNDVFMRRFSPGDEIYFDTSDVGELKQNYDSKITNASVLFRMGIPFNAINDHLELGFDQIEGGDVGYIPMGLMPATMAGDYQMSRINGGNGAAVDAEKRKALPAGPAIKICDADELRVKQWSKFVSLITPVENAFRSKIRKFFFEQRNLLLQFLWHNEKSVGDTIYFDWAEQDRKLVEVTRPIYERSIQNGRHIIAGMLEVDFNVHNQMVIDALDRYATHITAINGTMNRQITETIQGILKEGYSSGETVLKIADRIKDQYHMARGRANLIARTETVGSTNEGELLMMGEAGVEQKSWMTAGDELVRENHMADELEGAIDTNEPFPHTGLMYPGDQSGDVSEIANCRCALLPEVGD